MIKKTLYFGNPVRLNTTNQQLIITKTDQESLLQNATPISIPIEDIGIVVFDNPQITFTHNLMQLLIENNTAIITCNKQHLPMALTLNLAGNTLQTEKYKEQIEATVPLKKQLWQQTIKQKIINQAYALQSTGKQGANKLIYLADKVKSGDTENIEARAAAVYWVNFFPESDNFTRERTGSAPNNLLNYGYSILRSLIARAIVIAGMIPTLGIHHHNRYNPFCLADDIMEPFRPYVDVIVWQMIQDHELINELTPALKKELLQIPMIDVWIDGHKSLLMNAATTTANSLWQCFAGEQRRIRYPEPEDFPL